MIEKLDVVSSNYDTVFVNEDSVTFFSDTMGFTLMLTLMIIILMIYISKLLFMLNWTTKLGIENHESKIGITLSVCE